MDAFKNVIANPGSVSARRALAVEWRRQCDARVELLERALDVHEYKVTYEESWRLEREMRELVLKHRGEWAGKTITKLATSFSFGLGLVNGIDIPGDRFLRHVRELFAAAPIQDLTLRGPLDFDALCQLPQLQQLRSLEITGVGDWEAMMLANCPHLRNLNTARWGFMIGDAGMRAIAASRFLKNIVWVDLTGNPCAQGSPTLLPADGLEIAATEDAFTLVGPRGKTYFESAHIFAAHSYSGPQPVFWPTNVDDLAWTP